MVRNESNAAVDDLWLTPMQCALNGTQSLQRDKKKIFFVEINTVTNYPKICIQNEINKNET